MRNTIERITDQIRGDIQSGKLAANSELPTRREIAREFNTTVDTIGKVFKNLEIEGLIRQVKGWTMRVNPPRERVTTNDERFSDVMVELGHNVQVEHLETPGIVELSAELATIFQVPVGTKVIERRRREKVDGVVYRYSSKIYLAELVPPADLAAMQQDHTYDLKKVIMQQRPLTRIKERVIARAITDKREAEILGTIRGAPVLEQMKINYDEQKRVIWIAVVVFNAQYFEKSYDYAPGEEPKLSGNY